MILSDVDVDRICRLWGLEKVLFGCLKKIQNRRNEVRELIY